MNALELMFQASWVVKLVLLCLLFSSILSWTVILGKLKSFQAARGQSREFLNIFWHGQDFDEIFKKTEKLTSAPVATVFKSGYKELKKITEIDQGLTPAKRDLLRADAVANISRALNRSALAEIGSLEKTIGVLATVGSATPFIGLFGTVWGIMNSFQGIGASGSANLAVVAPGIAEALIATAVGLGAAIPAVIAYNFFVGKIKAFATEMDTFSQDFLNIIQRSFLKS